MRKTDDDVAGDDGCNVKVAEDADNGEDADGGERRGRGHVVAGGLLEPKPRGAGGDGRLSLTGLYVDPIAASAAADRPKKPLIQELGGEVDDDDAAAAKVNGGNAGVARKGTGTKSCRPRRSQTLEGVLAAMAGAADAPEWTRSRSPPGTPHQSENNNNEPASQLQVRLALANVLVSIARRPLSDAAATSAFGDLVLPALARLATATKVSGGRDESSSSSLPVGDDDSAPRAAALQAAMVAVAAASSSSSSSSSSSGGGGGGGGGGPGSSPGGGSFLPPSPEVVDASIETVRRHAPALASAAATILSDTSAVGSSTAVRLAAVRLSTALLAGNDDTLRALEESIPELRSALRRAVDNPGDSPELADTARQLLRCMGAVA